MKMNYVLQNIGKSQKQNHEDEAIEGEIIEDEVIKDQVKIETGITIDHTIQEQNQQEEKEELNKAILPHIFYCKEGII